MHDGLAAECLRHLSFLTGVRVSSDKIQHPGDERGILASSLLYAGELYESRMNIVPKALFVDALEDLAPSWIDNQAAWLGITLTTAKKYSRLILTCSHWKL